MRSYKTILHLLLGTIILSIIAFYNKYPLVYSDTGTYIYSGFDKFIPLDRPIIYGLFLRYASLGFSSWVVIFFQNIITAFVVLSIIQIFFIDQKHQFKVYYFILLFLVLFTGIGWYSNQLMPDFFAPLIILVFFILLQKRKLFDASAIIFIFILILSLTSHISHLLIGSVLVIVTIVTRTFSSLLNDFSYKRIFVVTIIVLVSWFIIPIVNYSIENKFILSKGSHVFLMAHLNDTGILKKFLNDKCSDPELKDCALCSIKDSLPPDLASFIWSDNILNKSGGWIESKEEYNKIINAILSDPEYLFLNIYRSTIYGLIQLTDIDIALSPYGVGSAPYGQIYWRFNDEINNYMNSRQNQQNGINLKIDQINAPHVFVLIISLFIIVFLFSGTTIAKLDKTERIFLFFIILSLILNSFITAGLNSPNARFQARVIWLLPFVLLIIGIKNYHLIKNLFSNKT